MYCVLVPSCPACAITKGKPAPRSCKDFRHCACFSTAQGAGDANKEAPRAPHHGLGTFLAAQLEFSFEENGLAPVGLATVGMRTTSALWRACCEAASAAGHRERLASSELQSLKQP